MEKLKKIAIVGPESTGKSTLAADLAQVLGTVWVPEYARAYLEHLARPYTESDLAIMARGQLASEVRLAQEATRYLVCDTTLLVLKVWSQHAYGRVDSAITEGLRRSHYDLHLLADIDLPWEPDPLREHPEKRQFFFDWYLRELDQLGGAYAIVSGTRQQRLTTALKAMNDHLGA